MSPFKPHRSGNVLRDRARPPTEPELAEIPWLQRLSEAERDRAVAALVVGEAETGDYICRFGRPVTYWFGLVDGLLKMSNARFTRPGDHLHRCGTRWLVR